MLILLLSATSTVVHIIAAAVRVRTCDKYTYGGPQVKLFGGPHRRPLFRAVSSPGSCAPAAAANLPGLPESVPDAASASGSPQNPAVSALDAFCRPCSQQQVRFGVIYSGVRSPTSERSGASAFLPASRRGGRTSVRSTTGILTAVKTCPPTISILLYIVHIGWVGVVWQRRLIVWQRRLKTRQSLRELDNLRAVLFLCLRSPWLAVE